MAGDKAFENFNCLSGIIVDKYVDLANSFTQELSHALQQPMWVLFLSLTGLWIVIEGFRLITLRTTLENIAHEFTFVFIASFLLSGQGPEMVNNIYKASLSMMGSTANVALQIGNQESIPVPGNAAVGLSQGMHALTCTVEKGANIVFSMSSWLAQTGEITNPMPWIYSLVLIVPYFIVVVVYFSLVVLSIFRIQMIAALSPFLMLGFGFGWGRNMMKSGLQALIGTFMVLFGGTAAVAVMLYAVSSLFPTGTPTQQEMEAMASMYNEKFIVALMMGWLGTAFMTEATGMTNSITSTSFTNSASAIISSATVATAMLITKNPISKAGLDASAERAGKVSGAMMGVVGSGFSKGAHGAGYATGGVIQLIKSMKK